MLIDPFFSLQNFFPVFLSAGLFFIGMAGVLIRKNILVILMSLELMLNAVNLNLLAFSKLYGLEDGPLFIFFIICVAAAEAGVGLALAVRVYNKFKSTNVSVLNLLKENKNTMVLALILPPLIGFFINAFRFKFSNKALSGIIGTSACLISFLMVVFYSFVYGFESQNFIAGPWFKVGNLTLNFSFTLDALSLLMSLLITGVGTLIHLYSMEYMAKEEGITRYFAYLNLFVFMMLILVLADNLPLLFVGWEGVGLCSYLLIGFWFNDSKKVQAGQMAFVVNRMGDACFILGIFLLFAHFGTLHFSELNTLFATENSDHAPVMLGALLLFLGATGKSAQLPLYFWLPGAMAGPTPVSALIHAATMVTAGVYMIVRLSAFYSAFPNLLLFISWIGQSQHWGPPLLQPDSGISKKCWPIPQSHNLLIYLWLWEYRLFPQVFFI